MGVAPATRWALTAVPAAAVGIFTALYVLQHSFDSRAWVLVGMTLATYALHGVSVRRYWRA